MISAVTIPEVDILPLNEPKPDHIYVPAGGILEILPDGYGFIRQHNYLPGRNDIYVSPCTIHKYGLRTGDHLYGPTDIGITREKYPALIDLVKLNDLPVETALERRNFKELTPVYPNKRIRLENNNSSISMRIMDLLAPIGKGQRGLIVSQPKAGKTTLLKEIAKSITSNYPKMKLIILLIDERPEEVTDIKNSIVGEHVEVVHSTFDQPVERHIRVAEMVIGRAKRLAEQGEDVIILLDSITRLTRAYNHIPQANEKVISGGLNPSALYKSKKFFGAARNILEGGSLTILATALIDDGSKLDNIVFEEFKSTGNMELVLNRRLSEKDIFPAIDILKSGTRRADLLQDPEELKAVNTLRKELNQSQSDNAVINFLNTFSRSKSNQEYLRTVRKRRW